MRQLEARQLNGVWAVRSADGQWYYLGTEADARLLAAAPDLAGALQEVLRYLGHWERSPGTDGKRHAYRRALAALEKAKVKR